MNLLLITLAAMAGAIPVQAQPQRSPASIEGVVVKLGTSEPIAKANLQLDIEVSEDRLADRRDQLHRNATSDGNGHFIFENVAPGKYQLIATYEGGFVPAEYGQRSPTGQGIPFDIAAGQKKTGIQLAMSPTGAITGRVYDRDGEPLGNTQVYALRPVYKDGRRTTAIVQTVVSDDRGEYRLYWLAPGRYFVGAKPDASEVHITPPTRFGTYEQATNAVVHRHRLKSGEVAEEMYLPVYYPNTVDISAASAIAVTAGATVGSVDIAAGSGLITPHHIHGRVFDQSGQPAGGAILTAIPRTTDPYVVTPRGQSASDGIFDIPGVANGSYQIFANISGEARTLNGIAAVEVSDKDIQNVSIMMTPGFRLSGRFVMEANAGPGNGARGSFPRLGDLVRDPEAVGIFSGFADFNLSAANDGAFSYDGIQPGDFRLTVLQLPPDGYIKSMRMGNADVLTDGLHLRSAPDSTIEIVIGANAGRIEGSVVNTRGETLSNRTVVLVPEVRLRQRNDLYRVVFTDNTGVFQMQGITPGTYKLFAWENVETGAWQDPDFIQPYDGAGRLIRINEGSNENLQLSVIP
jgi:protocatechuate 3,4-dioxygenase beta subunit